MSKNAFLTVVLFSLLVGVNIFLFKIIQDIYSDNNATVISTDLNY